MRRIEGEPQVVDGPFAETRAHLIGFHLIDCPTLEAAVDLARELTRANRQDAGYEIRSVVSAQTGSRSRRGGESRGRFPAV